MMANDTKQAVSTESQYNRLISYQRDGLPFADDEIEWLIDQDTKYHNIALAANYEIDEDLFNNLFSDL